MTESQEAILGDGIVSLVEPVPVPQVDIGRSGFDSSRLSTVNGDWYSPQILGQFGKEILYLKSRMGFVKLALKNGVPLVPVYVFGVNDLFYTSTFLQSFRVVLTRQFRWVGQHGSLGILALHEFLRDTLTNQQM